MKLNQFGRKRLVVLICVLAAPILLISFQNCMETPQNTIASQTSRTKVTSPFAYSVKADRLGYMSCNSMGPNFDQRAYFTFRLGAVEGSSGLTFSDSYKSYAKTNKLTSSQILKDLSAAKYNRDAAVFMSIRKSSEIAEKMIKGPSRNGTDTNSQHIWEGIDTGDVASGLIANYQKKLEPVRSSSAGNLYGSLSYNASTDNLVANLNFKGGESGFLSLAFRSAITVTENEAIVGLQDVLGKDAEPNAYGFGLAVETYQAHKGPGTIVHSDNPPRTLSSVIEKDFETDARRDWSCPIDLQFKIVPIDQSALAGCANPNDAAALAPVNQAASNALKYARELLNDLPQGNHWIIDPNNRCIFPASASGNCYEGVANPQIQWDQLKNCGPGKPEGVCIHYFSVCYPTN